MAAGKGLSTRRGVGGRSQYVFQVFEDSDEEQETTLSPQHRARKANYEDDVGTWDEANSHNVHDHGDARANGTKKVRYIPPVEKRAARDEKTRSTGSAGSDHVDMPIKSSKDVVKGFKRRLSENRAIVYHFGWFDILIAIGSICVYVVDITTDVKLAVDYFLEGQWQYGAVTTVLIAGPSLITCCFGLHWYIIDYMTERDVVRRSKERNGHVNATPAGMWFCRFFFTILQFGPVVR